MERIEQLLNTHRSLLHQTQVLEDKQFSLLYGVHRENGKNRTISPADSLQALALWRSCLDKGKSGQLRRKRLIYRGPLRTSPPDPRATNVDVYSPRAA